MFSNRFAKLHSELDAVIRQADLSFGQRQRNSLNKQFGYPKKYIFSTSNP